MIASRSAGSDGVVTSGAVGAEELAAFGEVVLVDALEVGVLGIRNGGTWAQRGDERGERLDLLVVEDHRLLVGLRAGLGHRHPAGADLEVDRRRADVGERRAVLVAVLGQLALAVLAVAERAADEEELAALGDVLGRRARLVGLGAGGE